VLSTSLYFVVFGSAIGSRMQAIDGVSYAAFIIPGLIMLSLLGESISNASFGIYMPKWAGTIYELLSAPVSWIETVIGYVGAAATKSVCLGLLILATRPDVRALRDLHPFWMLGFLVLTAVTFSLFGFVIGVWADRLPEAADRADAGGHAADLPGRQLLFDQHAAADLAEDHPVQPGGLSGQRLPLELLRRVGPEPRGQLRRHPAASWPPA
jgi:hypothetical protein